MDKARTYIQTDKSKTAVSYIVWDEFASIDQEQLTSVYDKLKGQFGGKIIMVSIPPDGLWNKFIFWLRGGYKKLNKMNRDFYNEIN